MSSQTTKEQDKKSPKDKGDVERSFMEAAQSFLTSSTGLTATGIGIVLLSTTALSTGVIPAMLATSIASVGALVGLIGSSDIVVENAQKIGNKIGLSPLLIGTIAGVITSMPELFVSGLSAIGGTPEIGVGNIIGSNVANIMLILGATSLYKGISNKGIDWKFNAAVMGASTAGMAALMATGVFNPIIGGAMIALTAAYTVKSYLRDKKNTNDITEDGQEQSQKDKNQEPTDENTDKTSLWKSGLFAAGGIGALLFAADALVTNASALALGAGVTPALVSLIGVAIGTSLPELMVSLNAARKGSPAMAIGNVLGSNIFNILMVGGATALFTSGMPAEFMPSTPLGILNMGALIGSAAWAVSALWTDGKFTRNEGAISLGMYAGFCAASFFVATGAISSALVAAPVATALIGGGAYLIGKFLDKKDAKTEFNSEADNNSEELKEQGDTITVEDIVSSTDDEITQITDTEISNDTEQAAQHPSKPKIGKISPP